VGHGPYIISYSLGCPQGCLCPSPVRRTALQPVTQTFWNNVSIRREINGALTAATSVKSNLYNIGIMFCNSAKLNSFSCEQVRLGFERSYSCKPPASTAKSTYLYRCVSALPQPREAEPESRHGVVVKP